VGFSPSEEEEEEGAERSEKNSGEYAGGPTAALETAGALGASPFFFPAVSYFFFPKGVSPGKYFHPLLSPFSFSISFSR
jgi:hypothetical protein